MEGHRSDLLGKYSAVALIAAGKLPALTKRKNTPGYQKSIHTESSNHHSHITGGSHNWQRAVQSNVRLRNDSTHGMKTGLPHSTHLLPTEAFLYPSILQNDLQKHGDGIKIEKNDVIVPLMRFIPVKFRLNKLIPG